MDTKFIDELAKKITEALPPGFKAMKQDTEKAFKAALSSVFSKMDLVTREELDVQAKILERARLKLIDLERQLDAMQQQDPLEGAKSKKTVKSASKAKGKTNKES